MNYYKIQVALPNGGGMEGVTTMDESAIVLEIANAIQEDRMARIASLSSESLGVMYFHPAGVAIQIIPVEKKYPSLGRA